MNGSEFWTITVTPSTVSPLAVTRTRGGWSRYLRVKIETALPRLRIEFVQILTDVINDLAGVANPVEIKLFGPDLAALESYGEKLGEKLEKVDGLEDVYNGVSEPGAELLMHVKTAEANRLGMTP